MMESKLVSCSLCLVRRGIIQCIRSKGDRFGIKQDRTRLNNLVGARKEGGRDDHRNMYYVDMSQV